MNKTDLTQKLDMATSHLIVRIEAVKDGDFNTKPAAGGWSVAEVGEHLIILETLVNSNLLTGDATERPPDSKIAIFKTALADHTRVLQSPPMIFPTAAPKTKETIIAGLQQQRNLLKTFIQTGDLTLTPPFSHPSLGRLTGLEWVYFIIFHAERHLKQIDRIEESHNSQMKS